MSTTTSPPSINSYFEQLTKSDRNNLAGIGSLASSEQADSNQGSLAKSFKPKSLGNGSIVNIRFNYPWTLNPVNNRTDIPTIFLKEFKVLEGNVKKQIDMFLGVGKDKFSNRSVEDSLDVYNEIWQKNGTTSGWYYIFPYFNDTAYSMGTSPWKELDGIGPQMADLATKGAEALGNIGFTGTQKVLEGGIKLAQGVNAAADVALKYRYPSVGIADRPKMFAGHTERTMTIEFPLFNTIQKDDWRKNLDFIQLFASQNLFNKRDFITGIPPVWYEVEVPGQYFCWAASVTDFTVKNLGNIHSVGLGDSGLAGINVPDAYQISITMQEMVQPSRNQYERVISQIQKIQNAKF